MWSQRQIGEAEQEDGRARTRVRTLFGSPLNGTAFHEQHPWLFRWPPLLFTLFWITDRIRNHAHSSWTTFAVFYATFLLSFFRTFSYHERYPRFWLAVLFVLGYVYVPFDHDAAGEFVFPVVMSVFFIRQPNVVAAMKRFAAIELLSAAGVALELRWLHVPPIYAENIIFYMVAIGLSNFAYSRHMLASEQLERANAEIEHLAQVAERERIARDLHDLLGHTLTVIVLKSDVANRLFEVDPQLAHREIAEVEATARKALGEVREAVAGYRAEGLPAEIAQARRTLASAGVQLTTDVEPTILSPDEENVLCLVLREAVTNVIRHAQATACRLELHRDGSRLRMTVADNGNGNAVSEGNGLRGMRERLAATGGSLTRELAPDGGTRLLAELPLGVARLEVSAAQTSVAHGPPASRNLANKGLVQT